MRQKPWKIIIKTYVVEFPFNTAAGIQSTTYHRSKDCTTATFWSAQKGNDILKFGKLHKTFLLVF